MTSLPIRRMRAVNAAPGEPTDHLVITETFDVQGNDGHAQMTLFRGAPLCHTPGLEFVEAKGHGSRCATCWKMAAVLRGEGPG